MRLGIVLGIGVVACREKASAPESQASVEQPAPAVIAEQRGVGPEMACKAELGPEFKTHGWKRTDVDPQLPWSCSTAMRELGPEGAVQQNNIAFYAYGTETRAMLMKLKLNVNAPKESESALKTLESVATAMTQMYLMRAPDPWVAEGLRKGTSVTGKVVDRKVRVVRDEFTGNVPGGYSVVYEIDFR